MLGNNTFKEIQKQLRLKRYEPVWAMIHKLRKLMRNRDKRYTLQDMIELDKGYFTAETSETEKDDKAKPWSCWVTKCGDNDRKCSDGEFKNRKNRVVILGQRL